MNKVILGLAGMGCLVWMVAGVSATPKEGQEFSSSQWTIPTAPAGEGQIIAFSTTVGDKYQQVILIDPKSRAMSVYHIDLPDGKIRLRSVRNFHWDLQLIHLNGQPPLPREIQTILEQPSP